MGYARTSMSIGVSRRAAAFAIVVAIAGAEALGVACGTPYASSEAEPLPPRGLTEASTSDGERTDGTTSDAGSLLPECRAQRMVHLVAGTGGLAWFTLLWPVPALISSPQPADAYDDPAMAVSMSTIADHPLYVRKIGGRALWQGFGTHPMPSAFVTGTNQTHTASPQTTRLSPGANVVPVAVAAQSVLAPLVPVLGFTLGLPGGVNIPYGGTTPKLATAPTIEDAVNVLEAAGLTPAQKQLIRPDAAKLATWGIGSSSPPNLTELAQLLLFTANAFRLGLLGTVIMPAMPDDPHGAFATVPFEATRVADSLARVLDGFYGELAAANELACGHNGAPLSLADNVLMVVSGDTPKNSFQRSGWPDGTVGNSNVLYVRSNGWLQPGWFGNLGASRSNFDPATGLVSASATVAESTNAALTGFLYAVTRGSDQVVATASGHPYKGTIAPAKP